MTAVLSKAVGCDALIANTASEQNVSAEWRVARLRSCLMNQAVTDTAIAALLGGPRHAIAEAFEVVPNVAGLYAVYGDEKAVAQLEIGRPDRPLYVGKAERSLVSRDLRTHFATGKTGSSTLRRSVGSLLRERLALLAVPRNLDRPDGSANFSFETSGDQRLTEWMHAHLLLAVWARPEGVLLDEVETFVLREVLPPLNLAKMGRDGDQRVKAARAVMATEAREWSDG